MCSLLYSFSSLITGTNQTHLYRVILLCLHIINSFPAHILLAGCDYYEPLTLLSVVENEETSTVGEELLNKKEECVAIMEQFEKNAAALKKRNCWDYDDETLFASGV